MLARHQRHRAHVALTQCQRQRAGDVGEAAGLDEGIDFGGDG
jgi:hypothetical protein